MTTKTSSEIDARLSSEIDARLEAADNALDALLVLNLRHDDNPRLYKLVEKAWKALGRARHLPQK